ncbi:MAG: oligoendopeptidase F [Chlamydia sp.]
MKLTPEIERKSINHEDTWDLAALYSSFSEWEYDLKNFEEQELTEKVAPFIQNQTLSAHDIRNLMDLFFSNERIIRKIYTYAHLLHDQETSNDSSKQAFKRAQTQYNRFMESFSWIEPKLLSLGKEKLQQLILDPILSTYATAIERIIRLEKHTLSEEMEQLLAMSAKATAAGGRAFRALTDSDFQFDPVADSEGNMHLLTHSTYGMLLRSCDRTLRENAFKTLHDKFRRSKSGITEMLSGEIEQHWFYARAKHFESSLDAALFPKSIDTAVYRSLICSVKKHLPLLHSYMKIRKELLKVETLHMWDLYVPLIPEADLTMNYDEAVQHILASLKPLGSEYVAILEKGLTKDRWVDKFENRSKRSGAYSSGCYDSHPYILMNYKNILRDVFTLAHEAGHSMHSYLSREAQPYQYAEYEIFVAEVASTFNETLLANFLLERVSTHEAKASIINERLEDIRGTLFRQTLFAEFELFLHESIEKGLPITPDILEERYLALTREYFGPDVYIDSEIGIEWARIPHFYYNFYVYQYATGISAALALADALETDGKKAQEAYLTFLKGGSSLFPIELLKRAGVDMTIDEPVDRAMQTFATLLEKFRSLAVNDNKC